ncbi:MAG: RNA 2',3'-cyclic phosphodiesterase [Nitrospinae bacterium]|nr:RNA 2',3'-cyclic phosphodiesterase [Nitrospinota bacterium]
MRVFLAIPLSPDEHKMLESLQVSLATMPALDDFRWARPENIHITLRFMGDIEEEKAEAAAEALRRAGEGAPAFDISIDRFGVFPNLKRPNVLWTGPSETPEPLAELEANLSRHLAEAGFPAREGHFRPHLTIARRRSRDRPPAGLEGELEVAEQRWLTPPLICRAREAVLFRSELNPSGAIHTALEQVTFG